ncbi:Na+/H+ antiporter subunit A [Corynebacterium glutamicum]|uniref:Na+/H+ antiporter subunit A n=1 Tax=Corynebacterium glutamicum TaxID=1718 RepID=UPI0009441EA4|nr:Na+/H+ antiporter subunit A [Corynebacterium glutamicum]OKX87383.1 Na+/H+ antiporter subunit A [Corynebacterium glutamicum]QDX76570.1 cation:proton antiporter [Corynebacterium glutamicum]QDX79347.1 cation:proton antiporter [Corynebacterium glutamicum]TWS36396.1 cation:proton antiporter [Corynebacterium glutamicum]TWS36759.1 cation:proton antiporter [Corynebacterium glutamicum]
MLILFLALTAAAVVAPILIRTLGRPAFGLLALVPGIGFFWVLSEFIKGTFKDGGELLLHYAWMPSAHLNIDFRMDSLAALFSLIVLGVGALVLLYCWGYFDSNAGRLSAFGAELVAFAMAMFGLVISDNILLMYVFWEITSVLSFLLVGYYGERASSRRSAGQALMVTTLGGLAMLVGIILMGTQTGVWRFSEIPAYSSSWADVPYISAAAALILAGALSKSAIAPTHFWLPGAMAAPTPVSAYLHSAAMVKAGIYLVARLSPDLNVVGSWYLIIIPLGMLTMLMGGWMALRQKDLKLILAYGTVSQLGFIISVIGIGTREALLAGLALTVAHSLFKATLFMTVGAIDHTTGTRDIRKLSGLWRKQPILFAVAAVSAASMAGIPPLFGFIAKETALDTVLNEQMLHGMPGRLMLAGIVLGSIFTMAYSCYFLYEAFATKHSKFPESDGVSPAVKAMHPVKFKLWIAPVILAILTVVFGVFPKPVSEAIVTHLDNVTPSLDDAHTKLALWHGLNLPLLLSVVIIISGFIIFWERDTVERLRPNTAAFGSADTAYDAILDALRVLSHRLTASTQRGSLTLNVGVIFFVLTIVPLIALITGEQSDVRMELWDSPVQGFIAAIIIVVAIVATTMDNRLSALILVGATGYGIAVIFALHGAPDLALTQVLVETIVMVVFMLVLRKMPTEVAWKAEPKQSRVRAWLAGATGLSVVIVTIFAMNARTTEPISVYMQDLAYEIGHGANTVNVLLVDLRGFDTFGEISVLVIAATGIASLVYRNRSFRKDSRRPTLATTGRRWLAAAVDTERAQNRSLMVDVATRILFPAMIMLSVYFFFAGHNAPGGGFAGGLVASLAFSLRYLAGGREELEEALPIDAGRILGTGLFVSATAVLWPMVLLGEPPLTSHIWDLTLPLIGEIHIASALLFDLGVYLIVIGLTMHILNSLGGQLDRDEEMRKQRARDRARRLARNQRREAATVGARRSNEKSTRQMPTIRPPGADTESVEQNGENQTSISTKRLKQEGK